MAVDLAKSSIDLGIVTRNPDRMVTFYRDTLGLEDVAETGMPGGGKMHRLLCGESLVKLVQPGDLSDNEPHPGGIVGASGYRYFTICVNNLDEVAEQCSAAGHLLPIGPMVIREGVRICMVEDPDGNWVELLEQAAGSE